MPLTDVPSDLYSRSCQDYLSGENNANGTSNVESTHVLAFWHNDCLSLLKFSAQMTGCAQWFLCEYNQAVLESGVTFVTADSLQTTIMVADCHQRSTFKKTLCARQAH